jgi:transketolase
MIRNMELKTLNEFQSKCTQLRKKILELSYSHKSAHLGSSLSIVEILITLFYGELRLFNPENYSPLSDQFILSKGHAAMALYATLEDKKFISHSDFKSYASVGSIFEEHPNFQIPTVVTSTGSLGHGLPFANGLALASKLKNIDSKVYVLMSDGECNEGTVWEAARFASVNELNDVISIIDLNKWQATGPIRETWGELSISDAFESHGWNTSEIDGHDIYALQSAYKKARESNSPTAIICHTVKGKGISFMENDNNWHYKSPNDQEYELAIKELNLNA